MTETQPLLTPGGVVKGRVAAPSYECVRWVLLRGLGMVYLVAFGSFWGQVDGLIGAEGIAPARTYFEELAGSGLSQWELIWKVPTLCWLAPQSDLMLHGLFAAGMAAAALLVLGLAPRMMAVICWACYLSVVVAGQMFLSFQWDVLLLEAGLLGVVLAPGGWAPRLSATQPVSLMVIWLFRWLVFRLMFTSGVMKLASGDPTWWGLTALDYHYFTQPLPNVVGWYAHQMPGWFQATSVVVLLVIEITAPLLIFTTRQMRLASFILMSALMAIIFCTGNFCFFNALAFVLFFSLLDDKQLRWLRPKRLVHLIPKVVNHVEEDEELEGWPVQVIARNVLIMAPLVVWIGFVSLVGISDTATACVNRFGIWRKGEGGSASIANPVRGVPLVMSIHDGVRPFRSVNKYGLFVSMTTKRPEIEIEGSYDGVNFKPYVFKYKVGPVNRQPEQIAPMQPRLDWQMWFEALGAEQGVGANTWFRNLLMRLLEGSEVTLDLLEENPFKNEPPRFIRAVLYDYTMTDSATRAKTGAWWERQFVRLYVEPVKLGERK